MEGVSRKALTELISMTNDRQQELSATEFGGGTPPAADEHEVPMPKDWNDRAGWDAHYESQLARSERDPFDNETGSIRAEQLPEIAENLKSRGWLDVWVPGCGLAPLARLLAHVGLRVVATDVSPVAVEFQRGKSGEFAHLTTKLGPADSGGSFAVEPHDFRTVFQREAFDLIINVKAFQGFPLPDMERIAGVHAAALRKGRRAYFDTMNVQGELRDQLEQALPLMPLAPDPDATSEWN